MGQKPVMFDGVPYNKRNENPFTDLQVTIGAENEIG